MYYGNYTTPVEVDSLTHITISQLKHIPTLMYYGNYTTPVEVDSLTHITISQLKHIPTLMYYGNYTTPVEVDSLTHITISHAVKAHAYSYICTMEITPLQLRLIHSHISL